MADSKKYGRIKTAFVKTLEDLVQFRGNDPMIARIYSMIVLSPEPLTQEQIANRTGYSRSQISRYLANLEQRQMVTKESTPGSRTQLYGGTGCSFCSDTGYLGRVGLFEVLALTDGVKQLFIDGAAAAQIRAQAVKDGMVPLIHDGMVKVEKGITTISEVLRNSFY